MFLIYVCMCVSLYCPFGTLRICDHAFSIISKNFLWVELHEIYTAQNMSESRTSTDNLHESVFSFHENSNMQRSNGTEIDNNGVCVGSVVAKECAIPVPRPLQQDVLFLDFVAGDATEITISCRLTNPGVQ